MFKPIERHFVHKTKEQNVLLSNLRRVLPDAIEAASFEALLGKLGEDDRKTLEFVYVRAHGPSPFAYGDHYLMREVSGTATLPAVAYNAIASAIPDADAKTLSESYSFWVNENIYVQQKPLSDELSRRVIRLGNLQGHYVPNDVQTHVSAILEENGIGSIEDVYFANMLVDTKHEFFFEHENEHVPGLMVLEAARQVAVALPHKFGRVPLKGSNLILDQLDARFQGYLELYAPILLRTHFTEKREHHGIWSYLAMIIEIYQNGQHAGTVHCSGNIISSGLFERIRRVKREELKRLPFLLSEDLNYNLLLKGARDNVWHEARITELNLTGFSINQTLPVDALSAPYFDFVFMVPDLGLTKGTCTPSQRADGGLRLVIDNIGKAEEARLELILKRHCKVPEEVAM